MKKLLLLMLAACPMLDAQTSPAQTSLLVTRIYGIGSSWPGECAAGVVNNQSTVSRRNNYSSIFATGSGSWTVAINFSDVSCAGPWTSFGSASQITQASNPPIAYGTGYHPFIQIVVTGSATVTYSACKDFFLSTSVGSLVFPLTVAQGGTGATSFTLNGVLFGNTTSPIQVTAAGSQYQSLQAGAAGVPAFDAIHLDQSAATTGTLPVNRGGTGVATIASNAIPYGQGTSPVALITPGSQYQVYQAGGSGVPTIGALHLDQPAAITGICPIANGCTGQSTSSAALTALLAGRSQGSSANNVAMATGSFTPGNVRMTDASGNEVDGGAAPATTPSGTAPFQRFRSGLPSTFTGGFVAPDVYHTKDFNFATQTCTAGSMFASCNLPSGVQSITLTPCPLGIVVSGTYATPLYVAGVGTPEVVTPIGGTCTTGATTGTVTATFANAHNGAFTVQSATSGLQEALNYIVANPPSGTPEFLTKLTVPPGNIPMYAGVVAVDANFWIQGAGLGSTVFYRQAEFLNGDIFHMGKARYQVLSDFYINNDPTSGTPSTAVGVHYYSVTTQWIENFGCAGGNICIRADGSSFQLNNYWLTHGANSSANLIYLTGDGSGPCNDVNIGTGVMFSPSNGHGVEVEAVDGLTISGVQGGGGNPWVFIHPSAAGASHYVSNALIAHNVIDVNSSNFHVKIDGSVAGSGLGGVKISDNVFLTCGASCTSVPYNVLVTGAAAGTGGIRITGNAMYTAGGPNVYINGAINGVHISGNDMGCTPGAGNGCITSNGSINNVFNDNYIDTTTNGHPIFLVGATLGATQITGNTLVPPGSNVAVVLDGNAGTFPSSLLMTGNKGVDEVWPALASAATLTLPINPNFTLTGSTTITALTAGWCWEGRTGYIRSTDGSVGWTASGSIGNTFSTIKDRPTPYSCNGGKIWIGGLGQYTNFPIGTDVASGGTITPTGSIFHITGTAAIATINLPDGFLRGCLTLLPTAAWTTTTAGNIALASTAVANKTMFMCYDPTTVKWTPSY